MRVLLLGLMFMPAFASAQSSPSFDYFGVGLSTADYDVDGVDADGWMLEGSFSVRDNLYFFGKYATSDIEFTGLGTIDSDLITVGGGLKTEISDNVSLYGGLGYLRYDVEGFDGNGLYGEVGLRYAFNEHYEIRGTIQHAEVDDADIDPVFGIAGDIHLTEVFAVNVGVSFEDDVTSYGVGFRLYFDRDPRR